MRKSMCLPVLMLLILTMPALGQWLKIDTVTSGVYDDHSPQVDHGGIGGTSFFDPTFGWVIFERNQGHGNSIAAIRYWSSREAWDSSATTISPASLDTEQESPDVCSLSTYEGGNYVTTTLAAWQKKLSGIWNIWYCISDNDSAGWSQPQALTSDSLSNRSVKIRTLSGSELIAMWRKSNAVLYSIFDGEHLTRPETLVVSNFDSVEYDVSKNNKFVWTTLDSATGKVCLATGKITSVVPPSMLCGDTIRFDGNIRDVASMYDWYNPFFTFDVESLGISKAHFLSCDPWSDSWTTDSINNFSYDVSTVHPSYFGPFSGPGEFWIWETQTSKDTSIVFTVHDTASTFASGHNPSMGILFLCDSIVAETTWNFTSSVAVWESVSGGYSHICGRAFLFSIIDEGVKPRTEIHEFNLSQNYPKGYVTNDAELRA
ncbi:MAG TPA: hypothetical protein VLX91_05675 [Candidatus Acidoferrales bacterium]|nr:hypothetical protein [Candidatus Acidoferrales bacterium]